MKLLLKKVLWEGKFLRVQGREFLNKKGNKEVWECVERRNSEGIVSIFPVTKNKELVLVKQFRLPLDSYAVELPAGLCDKPGEEPEVAARRELLEETGYKVGKMIKIQHGPFNSGMSDCEMTIFYAPDVQYYGFDGVECDDSEEIEVIKVPLGKLVDFCIAEHKDFKVDIKILAKLKILEYKGMI